MAKGAAKSAGSGGAKRVVNKHLHARVAYLDRISKYMALQQQSAPPSQAKQDGSEDTAVPASASASPDGGHERSENSAQSDVPPVQQGLPYLFASHLRAVSLKSQISLSQDMKHSYCKVCNCPLITGQTAKTYMENRSKGGRKPQADVRVISCLKCHAEKRFPVGARRQTKKSERMKSQAALDDHAVAATDTTS